MRRISLVLGGARSGKSAFAERRIVATGLPRIYLATAQAFDAEMADRIEAHRTARGPDWQTVDAPLALPEAICRHAQPGQAVLVDCLTLWLSNLMLAERDIGHETQALCQALGAAAGPVTLVASEVGLSIVPDNALARAFRDHAGRINQTVAALADDVHFVAAGLPLTLKGS